MTVAITADPNGVYEVGIDVRHLKMNARGVVLRWEGDIVEVHFPARKLTCKLPARFLETLAEQTRRLGEGARRRGGSQPLHSGNIDSREWSKLEDRYLLRAYEVDVERGAIARELSRTVESIHSRHYQLASCGTQPEEVAA